MRILSGFKYPLSFLCIFETNQSKQKNCPALKAALALLYTHVTSQTDNLKSKEMDWVQYMCLITVRIFLSTL